MLEKPRMQKRNAVISFEHLKERAKKFCDQDADKMGWRFLRDDEIVLNHPMTLDRRVKLILKSIAKVHGVKVVEVKSGLRNRHIVFARHHACYRLHDKLQISLPHIGRIMGDRDHTTALNSLRKWEKLEPNYKVWAKSGSNISFYEWYRRMGEK